MNKTDFAIEVICFLYIVLFVYAATNKLIALEKFEVQMSLSFLVVKFAPALKWIVPAAELLIASALVIPKYRLPAMYAAFTLMLMFTIYIIMILNLAEKVPCSCGGILEKMGWKTHLAFNLFFVLLAIAAIWFLERRKQKTINELVR